MAQICITGNIGSGKSTLSSSLGHALSLQVFVERAETLSFSQYYSNPKVWSYDFHCSLLFERFSNHSIAHVNGGVIDRAIWETDLFAQFSPDSFKMSELELGQYLAKSKTLQSILAEPSMTIYLKCSPDTLMARIRKRARYYESGLDVEFISRLNSEYDAQIAGLGRSGKLVVIETDSLHADAVLERALFSVRNQA